MTIAKNLLYFAGIGLMVRGFWMMWPPLGWVSAGTLCFWISMLVDKAHKADGDA